MLKMGKLNFSPMTSFGFVAYEALFRGFMINKSICGKISFIILRKYRVIGSACVKLECTRVQNMCISNLIIYTKL